MTLGPSLVIVSGLSGAGRTTAMKALEDLGFFCVDNLPVAPGRNIASLVEVAARVHLLQRQGRSGAADLDQRLFALLRGERP